MAAEQRFIYMGGGRSAVPIDATHVSIDETIDVIPHSLFCNHRNIVELICHAGVKRIELNAFYECRCLRRVIIPGVEVVGDNAFKFCVAVTEIECPKLQIISSAAFDCCSALRSIDLTSARVVMDCAFHYCRALTDAKFGKNLESIHRWAFGKCCRLERVTIPLKNSLFTDNNIFMQCDKLKRLDLVEEAVLRATIDALLWEEWRNDLNAEVDSINQILPNTDPRFFRDGDGGKAVAIWEWIARVLRKIIGYKAQHRHILNEAASRLQLALPRDVVMNIVLPFLEMPSYKFEGEE